MNFQTQTKIRKLFKSNNFPVVHKTLGLCHYIEIAITFTHWKINKKKMQSPEIFSFILIFLLLAFDACESQNCSNPFKTISVSQSDKSNFRRIQSAIDSVPAGNSQWIHIQISPGIYRYISFLIYNPFLIYIK